MNEYYILLVICLIRRIAIFFQIWISSYEDPSRESSLYRILIEDSTDDYTKATCKVLLMIHFERLKSEKQSSRLKNANGFLLESFLI